MRRRCFPINQGGGQKLTRCREAGSSGFHRGLFVIITVQSTDLHREAGLREGEGGIKQGKGVGEGGRGGGQGRVYTLAKLMARGILRTGAGGLLLLASIPLLWLTGVAGQQCGTLYEVGLHLPFHFRASF
jgi:hypothetical protein